MSLPEACSSDAASTATAAATAIDRVSMKSRGAIATAPTSAAAASNGITTVERRKARHRQPRRLRISSGSSEP